MKKIIIFLIICILAGCKNKDLNVVTIIEENDNCILSINYPKTENELLNKKIKKKIEKEHKNFKNNFCDKDERQELNIDFKKNIINERYASILIKKELNEYEEIKTYFYDINKNKEINILNLLTNNDLKILIDIIKKELNNDKIENNIINDITSNIKDLNFIIENNNIYIYININKQIIIEVPLEKFDLKIKIEKDVKEKNKYTYKEVKKIINPSSKVIALTFDDGPSKYTRKIVDLLNEYDANATFFILGNKVTIYEDTLKYLIDSGNEIGNHSYNHKWLTQVSDDELINQINKTQDIIKNTLNYTPTLFRPTYGSVNKKMKEIIKEDIILWDIDTLDWKYKNASKITNKVLPKIRDEKIILMHDTYEYTYKALKQILPKLKEEGYQFVTVSELKEIKKIREIK